MPLDRASFIKDLNPSNPVGTIDKVSMLDDALREIKRAVKNTLPSMDGEVKYSTAELNAMKDNFSLEDGQWDFHGNVVVGVKELDDDEALLPRKAMDKRYLLADGGLGQIPDTSLVLDNLFKEVDYNSEGIKSMKIVMSNLMYPLGSLYYNAFTDENPGKLLGVGTWVPFGAGRVIIGAGELHDGVETKKFGNEAVGGKYSHTLSADEMPAHTHDFDFLSQEGPGPDTKHNFKIAQHGTTKYTTKAAGGSKAHNIMQPYIAVSVWKRTA